MASKVNRRQHERHPVDNAVSVTSKDCFQLVDISKGGFSIKCPPYTGLPSSWETDILNPIDQLIGYPAKRVWVSMPAYNNRDFLPMVVGVQFGKLSKEQNDLLSQVIKRIALINATDI